MVEVFDYYAQGLDKRKDVVDLHKNAKTELEKWRKKAQGAKDATIAADATRKRDLWAKAAVLFSTEAGRQKYDAELTAWQNSIDAQRAKGQADQLAKEFASATETVLELVARAWEELDKGNLQAASQVASKAMRVDAAHWEAYLIAGIASFRQNDFDESMSCMRQAARLNPNSAQVYGCLGELYERQDNWQEAFSQYSKAIALAPDDIDFKIRAGLVCVKAEAPDQGIELLRKALEIDPDHQGAKWALGMALAESARLGWTEVLDGHPRVPPGWYAMSREQALQAVRKLHEANALGIEDKELTADLATVKQDVDRNIKRHFDGNWVLFGVILLIAFFLNGNIGVALLVAVLAAAYYGAHLPPQYSTNARILAGDSKLKTGFLDWLENIQNPWIKLTVNLILIALLPVFTLYWAAKNWTGENAPLGDALQDIRGPTFAPAPQPVQALEIPAVEAATSETATELDEGSATSAVAAFVSQETPQSSVYASQISDSSNSEFKFETPKSLPSPTVPTSLVPSYKKWIPLGVGIVALVIIGIGGMTYYQGAKREAELKAAQEQAELRMTQEQVMREQESVRQREEEARVLAEKVKQLEAEKVEQARLAEEQQRVRQQEEESRRLGEQVSVTIRNSDCHPVDLYISGRRAANIPPESSQTITVNAGSYEVKACLPNSSNCGNPTPVNWSSGTVTHTIYRNVNCNARTQRRDDKEGAYISDMNRQLERQLRELQRR